MKKKLFVSIVMTILVVFFGYVTLVQANTLSIHKFQITNSSDQDNAPIIFENTVVFRRHSNPDVNIFGYNLNSKKEFPLVVRSGTRTPDALYENNLVYTEDVSSTDTDVHLLNIKTGKDINIATGSNFQRGGAIWQNNIAYIDGGYNCGELFIYNINTKNKYDSGQNACWPLRMRGNEVVWSDWNNSGVYSYNVDSKVFRTLVSGNGYFYTTPDIFDNNIVWVQYDNFNNYYIYSENINNKKINLVKTSSTSILSWPTISNDYIAWVDNEGVGAHDIFIQDRNTKVTNQISKDGPQQPSPAIPDIYRNTVVWMSWVSGNGDIYGATIK